MLQCTSVSEASWKTIAFVAPARPGERGGKHERRQLEAIGAVSQRDGARLVVANRLEHLPEGRMDDAIDEEEGEGEDREDEVVHRRVAREVDHAEELAARHRLDAVLAAGERRLEGVEEDHLRERERDHREVDALAPNREQAREHAEHRGRRHPRQDGELGRESPHLGRMRREIARHAEEHRVAERKQPAEADEEIERAREEREAQRLHQEHRVDHGGREDEDRQHDEERVALIARLPGFVARRGDGFGVVGHYRCPKSPCGRIMRTIAMMTKITVFDASG